MHAEPDFTARSLTAGASRFFCTASVVLLAALSGCKSEVAPDDPTVIGVPAPKAWLGVEYAYNFGAYGGNGILDYSLSNAPSWLALEDTSNKARQGVIMRGVPGVTGGHRGDADLGTSEGITLLTTDGQSVGLQPFKIDVRKNLLKLVADPVQEGVPAESETTNSKQCAMPVLDEPGEHGFSANVYDSDGEFDGTESRTYPTTPMLVRVQLDQPSVTKVQVAFELTSAFDPENPELCDTGATPPHQQCEFSASNRRAAIIGQDVVAWTSTMPEPDYLTYQKDDNDQFTKGVVTLEPGITECFIRLEIVDDDVAEVNESFQVTLTEVRNGVADFDGSKGSTSVKIDIKDNEPHAWLQTVDGSSRDVMNTNEAHRFTIRMEGEREGEFRVRIGEALGTVAGLDSDYQLRVPDEGKAQGPLPNAPLRYALTDPALNAWVPGNTITFPADVNEASFLVVIEEHGFSNSLENDKFILLNVDDDYQAGRPGYVGSDDSTLRIGINQLTGQLTVGQEDGFHITSIAVGHDGRTFVAGYDRANRDWPRIDIYDQKGAVTEDAVELPAVPVADDSGPVIHYAEQSAGDMHKRQLLVSFGTAGELSGFSSAGGVDLVTALYAFDEAPTIEAYIERWRIQTGTSGEDMPRSVAIDGDGNVFVTGETSGQWPEQSSGGSRDSFVQRIDTRFDGDNESGDVTWTRQAGSSADDSVVNGMIGANGAMVFGYSTGDVEGQPGFGGTDFYYYSAFSKNNDLNVIQRGTDADDQISDGLLLGSRVWLLGNSWGLYETGTAKAGNNREIAELTRRSLNSNAGFLLQYLTTGEFVKAIALNDAGDTADERFNTLTRFDDDLIVAGATNGVFGTGGDNPGQLDQPVVARVSLAAESQSGAENRDNAGNKILWQVQPKHNNAQVIQLAQYRDDEIVALIKEQATTGPALWKILLLSGQGRVLNEL